MVTQNIIRNVPSGHHLAWFDVMMSRFEVLCKAIGLAKDALIGALGTKVYLDAKAKRAQAQLYGELYSRVHKLELEYELDELVLAETATKNG